MSNSPIRFPLSQRLRAARHGLNGGEPSFPGAEHTGQSPVDVGLIGEAVETRRIELVRCGQELNHLLREPRTNAFIEEQVRRLEQQTCKIAIIGQVKAGKSSFINAFVGKPNLLPTDVNPWTTAVTYLHFAKRDTPLEVAAEFTFFDRDEWQHLVDGGGQVRELTRRLVPGFEVDLLQAHVALMKRRAEQRLGGTLEELLGTTHSFQASSREVIERYVCSGLSGAFVSSKDSKGIFSDVTKSADLYFDQGCFGCATTIVDTPGTNDPFMVRDEITRRALETADIYIVVLTACQPLSTADLTLLRILRGLHKERIVIFINRIDELDNPAEETPLIAQHVRRGLQREFPGTEFPIVAGSAFWGNCAVSDTDLKAAQVNLSHVQAYVSSLSDERSGKVTEPKSASAEIRQDLRVSSGIPRLTVILNDIMGRHYASFTKQIAASFGELTQLAAISLQQKINQLSEPSAFEHARTLQSEEELRRIKSELSSCQRLTVGLHGLITDLQAKFEQIIENASEHISESLRTVVYDFIEAESASLGQAMLEGQRVRVWRCQSAGVRQSLETTLLTAYREAQEQLAMCEASVLPALRQLIIRLKPDWVLPGDDFRSEFDTARPSLTALSSVVALDLEEPWWKAWWTGARSSSERLQELDRLIRSEFFPIVDSLTQSARAQLRAHQQNHIQRSTLIYISMAELLEEQSRGKIARSRELIASRDKPVIGLTDGSTHSDKIAELTQLLSRTTALTHKIGTLQQQAG